MHKTSAKMSSPITIDQTEYNMTAVSSILQMHTKSVDLPFKLPFDVHGVTFVATALADQEVASADPAVASADPAVASADPAVASTDPEVASTDPEVALTDPEVASTDPVVAEKTRDDSYVILSSECDDSQALDENDIEPTLVEDTPLVEGSTSVEEPQTVPTPIYHYGKLEVTAKEIVRKRRVFLALSLDISDSMNSCTGKKTDKNYITKIKQAKDTLTNVFHLFIDKTMFETDETVAKGEDPTTALEIYLCLDTFNLSVRTVIEPVRVTRDNVEELSALVQGITASKSTNIAEALRCVSARLQQQKETGVDQDFIHIQFSDGDSYPYVPDSVILKLVPDCRNIVIGYGDEHNATLLTRISEEKPDSEYWFIENTESAGDVCGAIMHSILYPGETVTVRLEGAEVFDWRTNVWSPVFENLHVSGGETKSLHIRTVDPIQMTGNVFTVDKLTGSPIETFADEIIHLPPLSTMQVSVETGEEYYVIEGVDLTKDLFRLNTQIILHEVCECNKKSVGETTYIDMRARIIEFYTATMKYMEKNDLTTDVFMRVLTDDLFVANMTLGTRISMMYAKARQTAQGRQRSVNVSPDEDTLKKEMRVFVNPITQYYYGRSSNIYPSGRTCGPARQNAGVWTGVDTQQMDNNDDDDENDTIGIDAETQVASMSRHHSSGRAQSQYTTPRIEKIMRGLSS